MKSPTLSPKVARHIEALRAAGINTEKFFSALVDIRDDSGLTEKQRVVLYRLIASESHLWYVEAVRGEKIDRLALLQETHKILEAQAKREDK